MVKKDNPKEVKYTFLRVRIPEEHARKFKTLCGWKNVSQNEKLCELIQKEIDKFKITIE